MKNKLFFTVLMLFLAKNSAFSQENCDIIIKNREFVSGNLTRTSNKSCEFELKSGEKHKIRICNNDEMVAEFESHDLVIEKIIPAKKSAIIRTRMIEKDKFYNFEEEFGGFKCQFKGV